MSDSVPPTSMKYGRDEEEWNELEEAGVAFLSERAKLERITSYTETNTVLAQRTSHRCFDFEQDSERAAMGYLLGRISNREFGRTGVLISAIVSYLDANDAGPGFYKLAQDKSLLPRGQSRGRQWEFWATHLTEVFAAYPR